MEPATSRPTDRGPRRPSRDAAEVRVALRRAAVFAGGLVVLTGFAALYGWWRESDALTSIFAGWPKLKPNSAVLLVLCGTSLLLAAPLAPPRWAVRTSKLCAVCALLLVAATLVEYVAPVDLGIDQFAVRHDHFPSGRFGARPSPQTVISILLAAAALLALDRRVHEEVSPAQLLALIAGSISAVGLLGYAFDIPELYRSPPFHPWNGMALHTAGAVLVLSAGLFAARPDVGPVALLTSRHAGGVVARRLLLGLLAFLPVAFLIVLGQRLGLYDHADVSALLVFSALGEGVAVIFLTSSRIERDDQERRRTEQRLRTSEAQTRELFEQAAEAIFIADLRGRFTDANGAACRLLRLPRHRIVGQLIRSLVAPAELERLSRAREDLLSGGTQVAEWTMRRGDGGWVAVEVSTKILADGRWQAFVRDITGRRHDQSELERAREADRRRYLDEADRRAWLMSIIDQMPEGVILVNDSGGVEAMNQALLSLSSADTSEVDQGRSSAIVEVQKPDGSRVSLSEYLVLRALTRGEIIADQELQVRLRDGRLVPTLGSAAPVRDPEGRITGAVAVLRDITALKDLERLREEWSSIIAHDLRQPLGAISLTAQTLLKHTDDKLSHEARRAVERILSASKRLSRMIEDLLDFSRIEARRLSLQQRDVDFRAMIEAVVESHRDSATIRVVGAPKRRVSVDTDRIHQVFDNLISNAVKYGEHGREIRIDCIDRGELVEVVVTNHGSGIPANELPVLFSRFGRTRDARAERTPGIGLGLYITRGLIEAHGGRIWAESVPGESTSFHLTLPCTAYRGEAHTERGDNAPV